MAKLSEKYETMVVYSLKNGEEQVEANKAKFSQTLSENAEVIGVAEWGKRRLAYPINYENDGYYVLYGYDSKPDFPKEFERVLNITDGVLRFLTVLRRDIPVVKVPEAVENAKTGEEYEPSEAAAPPTEVEKEGASEE